MGFELTQEGTFKEFLGIKFDYKNDGTIECTQKGLIKKTLQAAGMHDDLLRQDDDWSPSNLHRRQV